MWWIVENLTNPPHHFCFINYVKQPLSKSTKFRCVVNTSTLIPNVGFTTSIETKAPTKTLNIMETSPIRFMLYPVVLIGDLRKAYRSFLCDEDTCHFCMLHWFSDHPKCIKSEIYKRSRVDYGDKSAAATLELFHWTFMIKTCILALKI